MIGSTQVSSYSLRISVLCVLVSMGTYIQSYRGLGMLMRSAKTKAMNITVKGPQSVKVHDSFIYTVTLENVPGKGIADMMFYYVHPSELDFEKIEIPSPDKFSAFYTKDLKRIYGQVMSSKEIDTVTFNLHMKAKSVDALSSNSIPSYFMFVLANEAGEQEYYRRVGLSIDKLS